MKLSDFNYSLPQNRIAQEPMRPRDYSRLFVVHPDTKEFEHLHFYNISRFLKKGDVLVLNNSKVIPARLHGTKETGGKVEILLVRNLSTYRWHAMLKNFSQKEVGKAIAVEKMVPGTIFKIIPKKWSLEPFSGMWEVECLIPAKELYTLLPKIGSVPTPPYIKKTSDLVTYQTLYAKTPGSVAAPTAGFHFTNRLLSHLTKKGVEIHYVTLHVGPGTFAPIREDDITTHHMHGEFAHIDSKTARALTLAKKEQRRIIAVGTTTVRTLEYFTNVKNRVESGTREIDLFIYPGYQFKTVNSLITNFHLPESTLLLLVCAFAEYKKQGGMAKILSAYREAVKKKYRFYSFGDAMFIE